MIYKKKNNLCSFVFSQPFLESRFSYVSVMTIFFYCLVLEIKNQVQMDKIFLKWVNKWVAMGNWDIEKSLYFHCLRKILVAFVCLPCGFSWSDTL